MTKKEKEKIYNTLNKAWKKAEANPKKFASLLSNDKTKFSYYGQSDLIDTFVSKSRLFYFIGTDYNSFDFKMLVCNGEIEEVLFIDNIENEDYNSWEEAKEHANAQPALYFSLNQGILYFDTDWPKETLHRLQINIASSFELANCVYNYFFGRVCEKLTFRINTEKTQYVYNISCKRNELYRIA